MKSNAGYLIYYKTIEILFGSLVIAFYYLYRGQEIPILPYLVLALATTYLFIFLIHNYQEKSRLLFFIIVLPLVVVGGVWFNFPLPFVLLLALLIYWRTNVMNGEGGSIQTGVWVFLTVFLGFILLIIANIQDYPQNKLVMIIVLNLTFIVIGGFFINWLSVVADKQVKRRLLKNFLSIMGIMIVLSLLLVAFRDVLKWLVVSILKLGVFAASIIMSPMLNWVENYELTGKMNPFAQIQNAETQAENESSNMIHDQSSIASKMDMDFTNWYIAAVLIILCILLFIYLYKKFQGSTEVLETTENQFYTISFDDGGKGTSSSKTKRHREQPSYRVRKEMYRLEKMAEKLQLGRSSSETIGEWFNRVGVSEDEVIQSVYERVRYGNQIESDEEYTLFSQKIDRKKTEFKQIHRILLQEGKIESPSRVKNLIKAFRFKAEEQ